MIQKAAHLFLPILLFAAMAAAAHAQSDGAESKIARIRLDHPSAQIHQVFIDRKPVTILYRKGNEVGLEITAEGGDGVACQHDVAVVTTDGRLADAPNVDFCAVDWIVAIDESSLSGGEDEADTADAGPEEPESTAEAETAPGTGRDAEATTQTTTEPEPETRAETDARDGSESQAQAGPGAADEPGAGTEPDAADEPEADTEPEAAAEPEAEGRAESRASPVETRRDTTNIEGCGWFAIMTCRREEAAAEREATRILGTDSLIATDDYRGLQPGYFCVARGPYPTESEAEDIAGSFRDRGAPDAYAKRACEATVAADPGVAPSTEEPAEQAADEATGEPADRAEDTDSAAAPSGAASGWSFAHPDSSAAAQATLTFVDPDSRAVEFSAACAPGSGEVSVTIGRAPPETEPDDPVNVVVATEEFRQRYEATVGKADAGPAIGFTAAARDPLWAALAGDLRLTLEVGTLETFRISLRGSAAPVRGFAATCAGAPPPGAVPAPPPMPEEVDDADAEEPSATDEEAALPGRPAARYVCTDGPGLEVLFDLGAGRAVVSVEGDQPIVLHQEGPEGRFAGEGFQLVTLGSSEATWIEPDGLSYDCRIR